LASSLDVSKRALAHLALEGIEFLLALGLLLRGHLANVGLPVRAVAHHDAADPELLGLAVANGTVAVWPLLRLSFRWRGVGRRGHPCPPSCTLRRYCSRFSARRFSACRA